FTWPITGKIYNNSGSYRYDSKTSEGCDSTYQMQLMINPEYHFGDTICALDRFVWSTTNQLYNQSGVYIYNHRSHKGCDSIEYLVLMISDGGEVYVPNVFTPNGDQINDRFFVYANEDVHLIDEFAVYNRWGEVVFAQQNIPPNDPQYGWNGIFRNQPASPAVFVYRVVWHDKFGGYHQAKGDVTLLR
ncbi:MAG: gliding motility-associated C-terminal domain-containing protein, partial [Saprospiraceae bacterium]